MSCRTHKDYNTLYPYILEMNTGWKLQYKNSVEYIRGFIQGVTKRTSQFLLEGNKLLTSISPQRFKKISNYEMLTIVILLWLLNKLVMLNGY